METWLSADKEDCSEMVEQETAGVCDEGSAGVSTERRQSVEGSHHG